MFVLRDSSDEEQVNLCAVAIPGPHISLSSDRRQLMWRRLSVGEKRSREEHSAVVIMTSGSTDIAAPSI